MQEIYRIGLAEVRPTERTVFLDGEEVALGTRAFDLLLVLIQYRDQLLTKQELLDRVWPGLVVEENNLSVQVSALRKVLGAKLIATIPGRGYRLSAQVDRVAVPDAARPAPVVTPDATAPPMPKPPSAWRGSAAIANVRAPLLGRDRELAELIQAATKHRLTTVVGPGGIGKTRLAIATAPALSASFADGVWLIELVGLRPPADLASQAAQVLGIQLAGTRPAIEELSERLRDQSVCLVLDNCEHVIDEAAIFAEALLSGTRVVHVLATSQEPLRLDVEHVLRVGALQVPASGTRADEACGASAIAMFRDRVRAGNSRFDIDDSNVATAIKICRELDGLPLAIELAAGRVGLLGVAGVHRQLARRFRLLTSAQRHRDARHRTLRATLDWSYALLSESEQSTFRRLGVMVGGFGLELAEQVAEQPAEADADAWLDALGALVDRSLVVVEGDARPRFRLLESARAYALEKLSEDDQLAAMRTRHAKGLLRALRSHLSLQGAERITQDEWTMTFAPEVDNLRAAIEWTSGPDGDPSLALDLLAMAAPLMYQLGRFSECLQWFQVGRSLLGPATPEAARANFEFGLAVVGLYALPYDERMALLNSAGAVFKQHSQVDKLVAVHCLTAFISAVAGQYAKAQQHLDACEPLFVQFPALGAMRARWLFPSAVVHLGQGDAASALACIERAIPLAQAAGDSRTEAYLLTNRGVALHLAGQLEDAERCLLSFLDSHEARAKFRTAASEAFAHSYLIRLDVERGAVDRATERLREALPLMRRATGARQFAGTLAYLAAGQGRLRDAAMLQGADIAGRKHRGEATPWLEQKVASAVRDRVLEFHTQTELASWYADGARLDEAAIASLAHGEQVAGDAGNALRMLLARARQGDASPRSSSASTQG
jgi:predicted ATPase/DNA-binding winged helix-turn-helix (wHTH) protein